MFPLGELTKPAVRDVARRHGLATAEKPESQEICFVPGGDYRTALRTRAGWTEQPGALIDGDGVVVGEHRGAAAYTVGQRQGLGVALGEPRYVSSIDAARTSSRSAGARICIAASSSSRAPRSSPARAPADPFTTRVRIRHRAAPVPGTVSRLDDGRWSVSLDEPAWAPAPGQAAVFYDADEVIGGGRIASGPATAG